jgi:hypothetical protein
MVLDDAADELVHDQDEAGRSRLDQVLEIHEHMRALMEIGYL